MNPLEYMEEAWDLFLDAGEYLVSFEWLGDSWEFIAEMFSDLNEFSYFGLLFSLLVLVFIYFTSPYMLEPFLVHMGKAEGLFWTLITYIGSGIMGYLVGKRLWDD